MHTRTYTTTGPSVVNTNQKIPTLHRPYTQKTHPTKREGETRDFTPLDDPNRGHYIHVYPYRNTCASLRKGEEEEGKRLEVAEAGWEAASQVLGEVLNSARRTASARSNSYNSSAATALRADIGAGWNALGGNVVDVALSS